jgi:putative membrane-bound dehydrogenase-like protein
MIRLLAPSLFVLSVSALVVHAQQPAVPPTAAAGANAASTGFDFAKDLPRVPPTSPEDALKTFTVAPGFKIEQVAAEPLVNSPVAMEFDENGRLWVCEMRGYSEDRDGKFSRISVLDDVDGDGKFDKSTVFLDGLLWPTALFPFDGGLFVADAPDIFYCKDANGDGRIDAENPSEKKVVFTGFGVGNVQGLLNCFRWGLDNRIHVACSANGGDIVRGDAPKGTKPINIRGRDIAFDPRTYEFELTSGAAQHGMSFDDWGHKFVSSNSDHLQQVMYEDRYVARNPFLVAPPSRVSIAEDGPQAVVYRTSPVEAWRIIRTKLRVSGAVRGAIEGGGTPAGYFTGAGGVTIYRGDAFAPEWKGMAIVGDVGSNLVHRKKLIPNGLQFIGRRIDEKSEFVASTDIWFRPAQYANAPDGTLYIADMCRETIEHPASIPLDIKKHLDLTAGRDRGRIYRVIPAEGFKQRAKPQLGTATTAELVALLEHPNAWHRETAARLIWERQDKSAVDPLVAIAMNSTSPLGRMHALYSLSGLNIYDTGVFMLHMRDEHPHVRRHATRLLERSTFSREKVMSLLGPNDDDLEVRYQTAFTLGTFAGVETALYLEPIITRDPDNKYVQAAVQSSLPDGVFSLFQALVRNEKYRNSPGGIAFLERLATQIALQNKLDEVRGAVFDLDELSPHETAVTLAVIRGLSQGLKKPNSVLTQMAAAGELEKMDAVVASMVAASLKSAGDAKLDAKRRVAAIDGLALGKFADVKPTLAKLIDIQQPHAVQLAAVGVLGNFADPGVADVLLAEWPQLSPQLKEPAVEALCARPDRTAALFDAIDAGRVPPGDLTLPRLQLLAKSKNAAIQERATKMLTAAKPGRRQDVVDSYRGALTLSGDPARGKLAFQKNCSVCHKVEGVGHEIGPNLATIKTRGAEFILTNLLDPSREVNPQFVNYVVVTSDGRTMTGLIASESAAALTLRRAENAGDTVLRSDIEELQSTGLSLMPEGLEKQLDKQAVADVIAYLLNVQ